ncbi:MAG TPA: response regulator [Phycisphaerales bacterium]|nr:response regulator [Phycisphaerales bacterium]
MNTTPSILVCDDQPILRRLLKETIQAVYPAGQVTEAQNGKEAERLFDERHFDLVFLDVEMPEQDGFTTLEKLVKAGKMVNSRVVMCTGLDQPEHFIRGMKLKADYYITKPFEVPQIRDNG